MTPETRKRLQQAYDAALAVAQFDKDSIRWVDNRTVEVTINGTPWYAVVERKTITGLQAALADCLNQHCAWVAANIVHDAAGGR